MDLPTKANLFKYLIQHTADGYYIDLFIFSHGFIQKFMVSKGTYDSEDFVTATDITNELKPEKTGFTQIPIRIIWGTNCYGQTLGTAWRSVGAKAHAGARFVEFYPHAFGNFIGAWNKGTVSFDSAVGDSDTDTVRTGAQLYISTVHAPSTNKEWGHCPLGKTVLGDDPCAEDYFLSMWLDNGEWQTTMSGKENMNYSSYQIRSGDKQITKNTKPSWR